MASSGRHFDGEKGVTAAMMGSSQVGESDNNDCGWRQLGVGEGGMEMAPVHEIRAVDQAAGP